MIGKGDDAVTEAVNEYLEFYSLTGVQTIGIKMEHFLTSSHCATKKNALKNANLHQHI